MHIVEIGCLGQSSLHDMIPYATKVEIFEANPNHFQAVWNTYRYLDHVTVHQVALWHTPGVLQFHLDGPSSYVDGLKSPSVTNDGTLGKTHVIQVGANTFDKYDDGTIDLLEIDIEGAEWYILEKMISRPRWITVELQWKTYVNPYFIEIKRWMQENGYELARYVEADAEFVRVKDAALV